MQPKNAIMGDNTGIDLPQMQPDEQDLSIEKNIAKFSKTKEWKALKEHIESRIHFYQSYMPNGQEIAMDYFPSTEDWRVANRVIGELKLLISTYEGVKEAVDESGRSS